MFGKNGWKEHAERHYAKLSTVERVEAAEKAQRLHEWIVIACVIVLAVLALSYLPDAYDLVHAGCTH
jgi:hypothetical protein